jgi:hypothetical protein
LRRDASAISPDIAVGDFDLHTASIEALLSCPHASPMFHSETQMLAVANQRIGFGRPIAIVSRDCRACMKPFFMLQPRKPHKLKYPLKAKFRGGLHLSQKQ